MTDRIQIQFIRVDFEKGSLKSKTFYIKNKLFKQGYIKKINEVISQSLISKFFLNEVLQVCVFDSDKNELQVVMKDIRY